MADFQKNLRGSLPLDQGLVAALRQGQKDMALSSVVAKNAAEAFRGGLGIDVRTMAELQKSLRSSFDLSKGLVAAFRQSQKDMALSAVVAKNAAEVFRGGFGINARAMADFQKSVRGSLPLDKGLVAAFRQGQKDMALSALVAKNAATAFRGGLGIDARAMAELQKSIQSSFALDKELTAAILRARENMRASAALANQTLDVAGGKIPAGVRVRALRTLGSQSRSLLLALKKKASLFRAIIEILAFVVEIHSCNVNRELMQSQSALLHELQNLSVQTRVLSDRMAGSGSSHPSQLKRHRPRRRTKPNHRKHGSEKNGRRNRPKI
jgi:hypothetical protein